MPLDARDLAAGLKVARARHIPIRIRSGGHSYIGASTVAGGVVFDLRRLRGIKLLSDGTVLAGAGLHADRADRCARAARAARSCTAPARPSASAGSRSAAATASTPACYGLACDNLVAAQRDRPAHAQARRAADGDLMHALRGAGASMAPVTSMRLQDASHGQRDDVLRRLPLVARGRGRCAPSSPARLRRPAPLAVHLLALRPAPARRRWRCSASTSAPAPPPRRAISRLLEPGASLTKNEHTYVQAQLIFAGCLGKTAAQCRPQSRGRDARPRHLRRRLGLHRARRSEPPARASVIDVIDARQAAGGSGVLLLRRPGRRDRRRRRRASRPSSTATCAARCRS